jgi:hypothetical protein
MEMIHAWKYIGFVLNNTITNFLVCNPIFCDSKGQT